MGGLSNTAGVARGHDLVGSSSRFPPAFQGAEENARRVFESIKTSADLGRIIVAETKGTLCGYVHASYEWRA